MGGRGAETGLTRAGRILGRIVIGVRELRKFLVLGGVTYLGGEGERREGLLYIHKESFLYKIATSCYSFFRQSTARS